MCECAAIVTSCLLPIQSPSHSLLGAPTTDVTGDPHPPGTSCLLPHSPFCFLFWPQQSGQEFVSGLFGNPPESTSKEDEEERRLNATRNRNLSSAYPSLQNIMGNVSELPGTMAVCFHKLISLFCASWLVLLFLLWIVFYISDHIGIRFFTLQTPRRWRQFRFSLWYQNTDHDHDIE